jgi:WD40 repeat protein
VDRDSPYQGLDAFAEADADFFFGRTRDVRLIVANLFASPFTVLYGPSGVGKTSVLHAGVLPALRERGIAPIVLRSWSADAANDLRRTAAEIDAAAGSGERARRRPMVVLDQFEDYFLDPAEDEDFAAELAHLVAGPGRAASVLVAIREDAVTKLDRFERRIPRLLDNVLRLDRLDRAAAREAILGPRDAWNARAAPSERFEVEDELVAAVLDSVSEASGRIETALLQLVMRRLWEERGDDGPVVLRRTDFDDLGGLDGIVETHVTGTLDALPADGQELAAAIVEHLVTPSRLRIAQRTSDLAGFAGVDEGELRPLLEELSGDRVLRPVAGFDAHDSRYEVSHDSLADAVLEWRTGYVTEREVEAEQKRARRRFRRLLAITVVTALAFAAMTALATYAWTQRQTARSEALSAEALRLLDVDPAAGLRKAREAVEVKSIGPAENALRAALGRSHERAVLDEFADAGVTSVDLGPGGRLLTTDARGRLTLRNAAGDPVRAFPAIRSATDAVFCPDASRIAVAVGDGALLLADGRRTRLRRDRAGTLSISCSRDGNRIVTVNEEAVRVYSRAGSELTSIETTPLFQDAVVSPDGSLVLTVGIDGARVVRVSDRAEIATLEAELASAAFSPDGSRVVAGGAAGDVWIWDYLGEREPVVLRGHEQFVRDVAYSRDGSLVVSTSTDRTARLWDATAGEEIVVLRGHTHIVEAADFSEDGRTVATASEDGTVRLWEAPVLSVLRHRAAVIAAAMSADGRRVATAAEDVRLWEAATGQLLARFGAREVSALEIAPDGSRVLTVHDGEGSARLWNPARPRLPIPLAVEEDSILSAAFVPNGSAVVTATANGAIVFFNLSGRPVRRVPAAANALTIGTIAVAPDGDRLATAVIPEGAVAILDVETGDEVARLAEPNLRTSALAWSTDGDLLVTAETDGVARIWETGGGEPAAPALQGHVGPLLAVSFDPDSELVVTAGADDTVRIWHAATGTELVSFGGRHAVFARAAPMLVLAGPGPTARVHVCRPCGSIGELRRGG